MNLLSHRFSREHATAPLHQLLLNFGKGLLQRPVEKNPHMTSDVTAAAIDLLRQDNGDSMNTRLREMTIKQLTTTLRMKGVESDDAAMLDSLESLALVGEISFSDYIGRVQNLFPRVLEELDVQLRMKIASFML